MMLHVPIEYKHADNENVGKHNLSSSYKEQTLSCSYKTQYRHNKSRTGTQHLSYNYTNDFTFIYQYLHTPQPPSSGKCITCDGDLMAEKNFFMSTNYNY